MQNRLAPRGGTQALASTPTTLESWECAPPHTHTRPWASRLEAWIQETWGWALSLHFLQSSTGFSGEKPQR